MKEHFVYIIQSPDGIFYKGYSLNPFLRLESHNNNESRYTAGKGPWTLVYIEKFNSKAEALRREKMLKRQKRAYIEWLINQPTNCLI